MTGRPNPDDLLEAIQHESAERGKLKVFLGASAGVGKTYAMLSEAHELKLKGVDVVIGFIETHRRAETHSLIDGLEQVPLREIQHRGAVLHEVDVEAVCSRRPQLVLIDELAHSNAPGSIHAKRWQDVEDILRAGIDVYTAVNVQHLESLNEVVAQVTGVRVAETVPDAVLEKADSIELIDIAPAELQQRLKDGKVYIPEKVDQALGGFFKTSNLTALRELALRRTADTVDAEARRLRTQEGVRGPWSLKERVVVCLAPNRLASRVVRAAARLGAASHAELIALHVDSDKQAGKTAEQSASIEEALSLAAQLGMEVVTLSGSDIAAEVMSYASRRNATLVVVGKPIRPRWKEIVFGSVVDDLVRASGDIDVHVITADSNEARIQASPPSQQALVTPRGMVYAAAAALAATVLGFLLFPAFGEVNVAMLYILAVAFCSMRSTRAESAICAVACVLAFNFCFVQPRYTFAVTDARYLFVFLGMLTVGLVISTLTHRLRGQLDASNKRERRTASLYSLSRHLAQGRGKVEMAETAAKEIREVLEGDSAIFIREGQGLALLTPSSSKFESESNERAVAEWAFQNSEAAGLGTDTLPGSKALYLPCKGSGSTVGIIAFQPSGSLSRVEHRQLLETFANSLGMALERAILAKASNDAKVQAESERIRSTLLSSISHDLRTPLTSIAGAASSLIEGSPNQAELASTIYSESMRLNRQIQNLLDMTRLQSGTVQPDFQWHSIPELVSASLNQTRTILGTRSIQIEHSPNLPLVRVDGLLLEKALVNLFENASRHTGPEDSLVIESKREGRWIEISVTDSGPGLAEGILHSLFMPGFKTPSGGYGLGLAVVKAVMDLHSGEASAENVEGGGAKFRLRLPLPDMQPEAPLD